jgi:hypothetical protein
MRRCAVLYSPRIEQELKSAPMCASASSWRCLAILSVWNAVKVLKRINAEIEARRAAGEDLPPPPKTAIAGPEYFGLNQLEVIILISCL